MPDFIDPTVAMATNPYMSLPQGPDKWTMLANMLVGVGSGLSQADASGRGWSAGIAPGAAMAMNMNTRDAAADFQRRMALANWQTTESYRKSQEDKLRTEAELKREELKQDQEAMGYLKGLQAPGGATASAPGFNVRPPAVQMGPGTYGDVVAGGESGGRYDIPNALGSGAYGKYQFMPTTWADVATKNPQLGLPFNIRQATPQQQEAAFSALTSGNAAELQKAGVQPTPENLYYAHRFGVDGAKRFIMAPPETPLPQLFPDWVKQNPDLNTTVGQFRLAQQGRFNGVPAPGNPQITPTQMPASVQPPRVDPMQFAPLTISKRLAPYGKAMIDIGNTETQRYLQDQDREMRRQQEAEKQRLAEANAKVGPDMKPNKAVIDAGAQSAAAEAEARKKAELEYEAASKLTEAEMARYSKDVRPGAEATANGLPNLYEMKRLLDSGVSSGSFIDARQMGARLLDTLGLRDMPDPMINRAEFNNRAGKNVLAILQTRALGAGTGISEGDRKFVESMAASGGNFTDQELKRLIDIGVKSSHTSLEQHDQAVARLKKLPGMGKIDKDYFALPVSSYDEWSKANPIASPDAAGSSAPAPAGGAMPEPKTKADMDKLPKGTTFKAPDGSLRVKP